MARQFHDFEITQRPLWRSGCHVDAFTTKDMLAEIQLIQNSINDLAEPAKTILLGMHSRDQALAFVLETSLGEQVGLQDESSTCKLFERLWQQPTADPASSVSEQESANILRALELMTKIRKDAMALHGGGGGGGDGGGGANLGLVITPDLLAEIHTSVSAGLKHVIGGAYRMRNAFPHGYCFFYTPPQLIESEMFEWTDALTHQLDGANQMTLDQTFKLAAFAMFNFVDVHPYQDCNGRMCRLIASSLLAKSHHFAVHLEPLVASPDRRVWRDIYIGCLQACRQSGPADLAALLVESSWIAYKRLELITRRLVRHNKLLLGTITLTVRVKPGTPAFEKRYKMLAHKLRPSCADAGARQTRDVEALHAAATVLDAGATAECELEGSAVVVLVKPARLAPW